MQDYHVPLEPGKYYHVYNRAVGNEQLFRSRENYRFFMQKYMEYIVPVAKTYSYCLMPNHFHFLVSIKEKEALEDQLFGNGGGKALTGFGTLSGLDKEFHFSKHISKQFSHFFNAYVQSFNKQHKRKGGLFCRPYSRKRIQNEQYLRKVIHYIHYNPVKAKLCISPGKWEYSSYNAIVSTGNTLVEKNDVLQWFDNKENFIYCHQVMPEISGINVKP